MRPIWDAVAMAAICQFFVFSPSDAGVNKGHTFLIREITYSDRGLWGRPRWNEPVQCILYHRALRLASLIKENNLRLADVAA